MTSVEVQNEDQVTLGDILNEANNIWAEYKKSQINIRDHLSLDRYLEKIQKEHNKLYMAYPTVIRHMIQEGLYHPKAFKHYLARLAKHPWMSDDQRLDSYADYYIILFKTKNKRWNNTEIQSQWKNYRKILQKEHDEFINLYDKYKTKIEQQDKKYAKERKETRLEIFNALAVKNGIPKDQIEQIQNLVNNGTISDDYLESIIMQFQPTPQTEQKKDREISNDLLKTI